jgi:hypothetical protein
MHAVHRSHTQVEDFDFEPLMAVAAMLYGTSFVAERFSGIRAFLSAQVRPSLMQGKVV